MRNVRDIVRVNVASDARAWAPRGGAPGTSLVASWLRLLALALAGLVDWIHGRFVVGSKRGLRTVGARPPFDDVVVAGTFDRLHAGHRLLIFAAMMVLRDGGNLWLGVTGDSLTKSKRFRESLEPYSLREAAAARFARGLVKRSRGITVHTGEITNPRRGIEGQVRLAALRRAARRSPRVAPALTQPTPSRKSTRSSCRRRCRRWRMRSSSAG